MDVLKKDKFLLYTQLKCIIFNEKVKPWLFLVEWTFNLNIPMQLKYSRSKLIYVVASLET